MKTMLSIMQMLFSFLLVSILTFFRGAVGQGTNDTGPLSTFKSRPDLEPPFLNITLHDDAHVTPGYIFIAPYQTSQQAIYIYDNRGNLVYSGFGSTGGGPSHNFHVCSVKGVFQLCFFTGAQELGYGRGHGVVMDNSLSAVSTVQTQGGLVPGDEHEFNVVDDGKAVLLTLYQPEQYDLSEHNITQGLGWIVNCYFQKVQIGTNKLLFEWNALDYVPLSETWVRPNSTDVSGTGFSSDSAWDYFHINSVDQNADGDYLVSARHTSTIYKISGTDGSIIWRLGGVSSDFTLAEGFNFTFQHDARWRLENATTTILTIFDNACNGFNQSSRYSSGKIIKIDHMTNSASLIKVFNAPGQMLSASQGNIQTLGPNSAWASSNVFSGWGSNAYIAEYTPDGRMVQQGHFATTGAMNYRAYKFNYTTNPTDAPATYAYAHNTSAPTAFYMSWNGATEAAQWRILVSSSKTGLFTAIATVPKNGFETLYTASAYHPWSIIESLNAHGKSLRSSFRPVRTFVPGANLAANCNEYECPLAMNYQDSVSAAGGSGDETEDTLTKSVAASVTAAVGAAGAMGIGLRTWLVALVLFVLVR